MALIALLVLGLVALALQRSGPGRDERAYLTGKLMRQAKPDDVFAFIGLHEIIDLWPTLERYLGRTRAFWRWILSGWEPEILPLGSAAIPVDARHEILVNKLCALLSRSELRDLIDVKALLAERNDLREALRDAPRKDAGFSAATLAWVLRNLPIATMAKALGMSSDETHDLETYRGELLALLVAESRP